MLTYTLGGLATAALYAVAASGLVVTYTTSGILNFAHGAFGMLAGFVYWQFVAPQNVGGWGWSTLPAVLIVVVVIAPIFGAVVERVVMRGLDGASEVVKVVVTSSLMLALIGVANIVWDTGAPHPLSPFFGGEKLRIGQSFITYHEITELVIAVAVAAALRLVLYKTRAGVAMRAVVDNRSLVQLNGARPSTSSMASWGLGSSLAAVSGILAAPILTVKVVPLTLLVVSAFAAAVVGKLRSLPWTFVGALIIGLGENYVGGYLGAKHWGGLDFSQLRFAVSPMVLLIAMVFQPQERLRAVGVQRVRESWRVPTLKGTIVGAIVFVVGTYAILDLIVRDSDRLFLSVGYLSALIVLSLVPLTGYAGQISLAQMSFVGIGAVCMAAIAENSHGKTLAGVIVATAVTGLVGAIVALPALRLSGINLALATTAFAAFMSKLVFSQPKVLPAGSRSVPRLDLNFFAVHSNFDQAMLLAVVFAGVVIGIVALRRGAWGRRLSAMKDSPVACATLGLNLTTTKIGVFMLSASIAGLAGSLWGTSISSQVDLEFLSSMQVTTLAVVGGVGAVGGALLGGMLLGSFQGLASFLFGTNAVGLFRFGEMSVPDLIKITPGFIGISLGRNPSGAAGDIADAYRAVGESNSALSLAIGGPAVLWLLAEATVISNWTFVATLTVMLFGVVPLLPVLLAPIPGGRAGLAGIVLIAGLVVTGSVEWSTVVESNGVKVVVMILVAIVVARLAIEAHGAVPMRKPSAVEQPSPDMLGIDRPLLTSDVLEAERMLGVREEDFYGTR